MKKRFNQAKNYTEFFVPLELKQGVHQFKFNVDGLWKHDTDKHTVNNELGGNSLVY